MRTRIAAAAAVVALLAYAYVAPGLRRHFIRDVITWDAEPRDTKPLPHAFGLGLQPWPRVRVILIDGLSASTAATLTTWTSLCHRGIDMRVDIGFPTVSLPVQVSLWTGLTQQQTGIVYRSDRPLVPPLATSIPAQVPGSRAVAENHGYIVRSIGFADVQPAAVDAQHPAKDADAEAWKTAWQAKAHEAIASNARLAFVHVLRVDTWGHRTGRESDAYRKAASESDAILAELYAAAPDARWFLLTDHGHRAEGGHGGEERELRQVQHCIVGPDVTPHKGSGPIHLVDMSRALADSLNVTLDSRSRGRPLYAAMAAPLEGDDAVPAQPLGSGAIALFILALGVAASMWGFKRWWLSPAWFVLACVLLVIVRGQPTMSMRMVYAGEGKTMYLAWLAALPIAAVTIWFGMRVTTLPRVLVSQLALPFAMLAGTMTACNAWPGLFGGEVAPIVARYTAYTSALYLITAHGSAAVALGVLARTVHSLFGRRRPAETTQSAT